MSEIQMSDLREAEGRIEKSFNELRTELKENYMSKAEAEKSFVSWKTFTWVVGILLTMVFGALGLIYTKQEAMNDKLVEATENISSLTTSIDYIKQMLNNAEITK